MKRGLMISTPIGTETLPNGNIRTCLITPEWHRARMNIIVPPGLRIQEVVCDGQQIEIARNMVAAEAVRKQMQYLFFLDSDVLFPPMGLARLVAHLCNNPDVGVVCGLYCFRRDLSEPMMFKDWLCGVSWDWTAGDAVEVAGTGTGAMLIRMEVFDDLPTTDKPWFEASKVFTRTEEGVGHAMTGEDLYFCKRVGDETKWKIVVDTAIQCGHIDKDSGVIHSLDPDCLPMRRKYERERAARDAKALPAVAAAT